MSAPAADPTSFGELLRAWRTRRRLTQLEMSLTAGVSTRHLSFLESGRARPSRQMVLGLAERLRVPLRERNELLVAAGFAPVYQQRPLDAPQMRSVRAAVDQVLAGHDPYPAVAVDRCWDVVALNAAAGRLAGAADESLLEPPVNVYRLLLHPDGLARLVINLADVVAHLLERLRHDAELSADPRLLALLREVEAYPTVRELRRTEHAPGAVVVPVRLRHPDGELAMFTTLTTFGTPADVTVDELALELFYPLDAATAERLRRLADEAGTPA